MPIGPNGERLPYPGDAGDMGNGPGPDLPPLVPPGAGADRIAAGMNGGPPMGGPPMGGPMAGQEQRLNQLLVARQMIDQEIAAIVGGPPGAENLDMLPPPPMDPRAQGMPPEAMMAQGGPPMPPMGQPMPPMGPQGLLGA